MRLILPYFVGDLVEKIDEGAIVGLRTRDANGPRKRCI